ncbi:hypothetical protein H6P81_021704 [Aristolochia fimbriata]|uniref:Uncharacterized protein n=1 Tax=Aristolochia fimbriata TaxID=158543 RepID=A0AAV7DTR3_ARIFI|nr:hypothetical protein H6P81_021704 [Aristolochia fimbriata]
MSREAWRLPMKTSALSTGRAAVGADLGGSSKYSNENFEGERGKVPSCPPGSGSAGGRVQRLEEHRRVAWCRCARRPLKIRRTECIRLVVLITHQVSKVNSLWSMEQCRQGKSAKWIRNREKDWLSRGWARGPGQSNPSAVGGLLSSCSLAGGGSSAMPGGDDWERPFGGPSGVEQPTSELNADKGNPAV